MEQMLLNESTVKTSGLGQSVLSSGALSALSEKSLQPRSLFLVICRWQTSGQLGERQQVVRSDTRPCKTANLCTTEGPDPHHRRRDTTAVELMWQWKVPCLLNNPSSRGAELPGEKVRFLLCFSTHKLWGFFFFFFSSQNLIKHETHPVKLEIDFPLSHSLTEKIKQL